MTSEAESFLQNVQQIDGGYLHTEKNGDRQTISWQFAVWIITVSFDPATLDASLQTAIQIPIIGRVQLAESQGNLKDGIQQSYNVAVANGTTRLYLKNGNEIWVSLNAKSPIGGDVNKEFKIFSI